MRETWYVLEDGRVADPNDVVTDEKGTLAHKDGLAVAMRGDIPHSRSVDADVERANIAAAADAAKAKADADAAKTKAKADAEGSKAKPAGKDREIKADTDAKTYETR